MTRQQVSRSKSVAWTIIGLLTAAGIFGAILSYGQGTTRWDAAAASVPVIEERLDKIEQGDVAQDKDIESTQSDIKEIKKLAERTDGRVFELYKHFIGEPNE